MNLFENQYQLAYVAEDFDQGVDILTRKYGVPGFTGLAGSEPVENTVWTPEGDREITMRAAIAQVGDVTIEVLQPVSGAIEIFTEMIVPGQPLRLHHIAMRCDDIDAVRAAHEERGRPAVMMGGFKEARFMYIDARATLGHFLEYASAPAEYWNH